MRDGFLEFTNDNLPRIIDEKLGEDLRDIQFSDRIQIGVIQYCESDEEQEIVLSCGKALVKNFARDFLNYLANEQKMSVWLRAGDPITKFSPVLDYNTQAHSVLAEVRMRVFRTVKESTPKFFTIDPKLAERLINS